MSGGCEVLEGAAAEVGVAIAGDSARYQALHGLLIATGVAYSATRLSAT